jgi:hypothetical protein
VQITADILANPDSTFPIVISPYKFDISQFGEKERSSLEFTIKNVSADELEVKLADMPSDMFVLTLPKKIKPGKYEKGKIVVKKDYLPKEFEKSITLQVNDKLNSRFTVPAKRTIRIPGVKPDSSSAKK